MRARDNPFSTDRILRIRYRLRGERWDDLIARLAQLGYRAAIVGPEGTGKTTLLEDLESHLRTLGFIPKPLRLDEAHRRLDPKFQREFFAQVSDRDIVLLDGAEQMGRWHWARFRRQSRCGGGLVITSHRSGLLPTWIECRTTPELLEEIVRELLGDAPSLSLERTSALFHRHQGNLRSALRELYDDFAAGRGMGGGAAEAR